jgi:hypothetical protein
MNERIKELWSQAEEEIKAEYEDESRRNRRLYNEIFLPKFAELIVRECAKEAFKYTWNRENYDHYSDVGWDCLPGDLQSHIEEHFVGA